MTPTTPAGVGSRVMTIAAIAAAPTTARTTSAVRS